jgi:cation diffusion facilitator CzcD-associated flavoprotein CzcO
MLWHITAENSITGVKSQWTANIVVNAAGLFHKSHIPNIPGISDFKGRAWHTMHWPKEADLEGKRVAVIGTGPSAGQVIPQIQPIVKSLTVYQRSTTYCIPRQDYAYSAIVRFLFNYVPFVHYIYYLWLYWSFEYLTFYVMRPKTFFARKAKELGQQHLESQVKDPILRKKLWPLNDFACKRPLILDDYYPALQQPNVELITDPVIQITSTGVVSKPVRSITPKDAKIVKEEAKTSDHAGNEAGLESYSSVNVDPQSTERHTEVDVIIWGTGFHVQSHGSALEAIGRSGKSLNEHWGEDPRSLFGTNFIERR